MRFAVLLARAVRAIAAAALVGACAFCAAADTVASELPRVPEIPEPSLVDRLRLPETELPHLVPPAEVFPAPLPVPPQRAVDAPDIVLVLPLDSPDYARAAQAVRDGFLAAAGVAGARKRVHVIAHADGGVLDAFDLAIALGPFTIVGPLVRDDLRTLVESGRTLPITLALNQLDSADPMPSSIYTLSLSVESDARVLAQSIRKEMIDSVAVIGGGGPLMKRFATAFTAEWRRAGGSAPQNIGFDVSAEGLSALRQDLSNSTAQAVMIALDGTSAVLARSFAPRMRAYTSSLVNQPWEPAALADLEGVVFVELPWIVTPYDPALARFPRQPMGDVVLQRLYALGIDAFLVARTFSTGIPERIELKGATGMLRLGDARHLVREGTPAVFRQGMVVPLDGAR